MSFFIVGAPRARTRRSKPCTKAESSSSTRNAARNGNTASSRATKPETGRRVIRWRWCCRGSGHKDQGQEKWKFSPFALCPSSFGLCRSRRQVRGMRFNTPFVQRGESHFVIKAESASMGYWMAADSMSVFVRLPRATVGIKNGALMPQLTSLRWQGRSIRSGCVLF